MLDLLLKFFPYSISFKFTVLKFSAPIIFEIVHLMFILYLMLLSPVF